ncbi:hypothetical protein [Nonomuraea africana]|uniref:hypothetical protein n=1 Tax=Nonomuraea africana TaxID=46171 RepID=UPI00340F084E
MITPSPPHNGDVFLAPTPEETFTLPAIPPMASLNEWTAWLPYLGCVVAGVIIGVAATLMILTTKRRRKPIGERYDPVPHAKG